MPVKNVLAVREPFRAAFVLRHIDALKRAGKTVRSDGG